MRKEMAELREENKALREASSAASAQGGAPGFATPSREPQEAEAAAQQETGDKIDVEYDVDWSAQGCGEF